MWSLEVEVDTTSTALKIALGVGLPCAFLAGMAVFFALYQR
jgi:hypothetical protein